MKLHKGLLAFLSGLGWMGLAFYIWFFTLYGKNLFNSIFIYSVATSLLGAMVVLFILIAFAVLPPLPRISSNLAGFLAGLLSMLAIIIILISLKEGSLFNTIHPLATFFLAAASTYLLLLPEEEKEEWKL
ncbi:MAG: hypothetical protein FE045_01670 [Thermoplasmata archaeon]|nr:MAG: hypothetical protein FE045_01670 [Thermoplasmata archaeon]